MQSIFNVVAVIWGLMLIGVVASLIVFFKNKERCNEEEEVRYVRAGIAAIAFCTVVQICNGALLVIYSYANAYGW